MNRAVYIIFFMILGLFSFGQKSLNLLPDTIGLCHGDSLLLRFSDDIISDKATYQWTTPKIIIVHAKQLYIRQQGSYSVKIYDGNNVITDNTFLKVYDKPRINIRDTSLCLGASFKAEIRNRDYKYAWSTGEVSESVKIDHPGKYWVKINNKGCFYTDTFRVNMANNAVPNFGKEMVFCEGDEVKLLGVRANKDVKLYWNTGEQTSSINAHKEGIYWVKSISKNCGRQTDSVSVKFKNCECEIFIPTSFTPNDDDRNDYFFPVCQCEYQYFFLTVYDRWGNAVYLSNNINGKWDGRFKGNLCPDDIYVYKMEAQQKNSDKKVTRSGHISLFR